MLTIAITNTSATKSLGPVGDVDSQYVNTDIILPGPLSWMTIAPSGSATVSMRESDLHQPDSRLSGFSLADALQKMVQKGTITLVWAYVNTAREQLNKAVDVNITGV